MRIRIKKFDSAKIKKYNRSANSHENKKFDTFLRVDFLNFELLNY